MADKLITLKDSQNNSLYPSTTYNAVTDARGNILPADFSQIGGAIQSDWQEQDTTSGAYILHKPNIPSSLSDLSDDSTHRTVTDAEKQEWSGKSDFSGNYNDLSNKPTIPSALADLSQDSSHRTVNDLEKNSWNSKSVVSVSSLGTSTDEVQYIIIDGVEKKLAGGSQQVQSNWNESDSTSPAYIQNKPTIPSTASDVGALPSSTKYGASLTANGTLVQLKDQDGNNLGTAISVQDSSKEDTINKVTSLSSASTDTQYPSAKCVYDLVGDIDSILTQLNSGQGV